MKKLYQGVTMKTLLFLLLCSFLSYGQNRTMQSQIKTTIGKNDIPKTFAISELQQKYFFETNIDKNNAGVNPSIPPIGSGDTNLIKGIIAPILFFGGIIIAATGKDNVTLGLIIGGIGAILSL